MKTTILIALAVISTAGCATVRESYAPDGRKAYALNCSGTARGWDKCLAAAGEKCAAAGYDVLDRNSEDAGTLGASNSTLVGVKTNERTMLVACKAPH